MNHAVIMTVLMLAIVVSAKEVDDVKEIALHRRMIELAEKHYARLMPKLAPTNVPFANVYQSSLILDNICPVELESDGKGDVANVNTEQFLFFLDQRTGDIQKLINSRLIKYVETNAVPQTVPSLSIAEAVKQAYGYLDDIGIKLPIGMTLSQADFNSQLAPGEWQVEWHSVFNGYAFDPYTTRFYGGQKIVIFFHEQYGFSLFAFHNTCPPPKSFAVKVTKEDAVFKGEKAVPLVMQTPFYKAARLPGFKISAIKYAELYISIPNWLLDPIRAVWLPEKPPKETRLCWVVRFETVDIIPVRTRNFKPLPPDITVYIDAATGEIVGASFS